MNYSTSTPLLRRIKWVFNPQDHADLGFTHAQVPTPLIMEDRIRVFVSGRVGKISHVFTIDITPPPECRVISISKTPIFSPNHNIGTFDDEGVMPSCFVTRDDGEIQFLYSGWNSRNTIPYHNSTGIAKYLPVENKMERLFDGPILERTYLHPYLAVTPTVWKNKGGFNALYISGLEWIKGEDRYEPLYVIKKATSKNLLDWDRPIEQFIPSRHNLECFSNPSVRHDTHEVFDVLFCSRNAFDFRSNPLNSYKIGYASIDGNAVIRGDIQWTGSPASVLENVMQCYPSFIEWGGKTYVIYNGNAFGATGFGLAEFIKSGEQ
ncbi:hypothetical protein POPA111323_09695 [Polynucleobacter paneuropaeus]|nr:hypothetical protein [Polynucleobacter paneuropaeus]